MPRWLEFAVIGLGVMVAIGALWRTIQEPTAAPSVEATVQVVERARQTETIEVVDPTPTPASLPGVPQSVGAALSSAGNAEFVTNDRLRTELPESVVAVLVEAEATLRVAEESP